jgi:hypothetical protein
MAPNDLLDDIVRDSFDLHLHCMPDVIPRLMTDIQLVRAAKAAGMAGVLIKCHHTPTAARAALAAEAVGGILAFGGLVLNAPAGGLNPDAVNAELDLGAKEIWMPTVSSVAHLRFSRGDESKAVRVLDDQGRVRPAVHDILSLVAERDVMVATGHLSPPEALAVIKAAQDRGVRKIVVTHPEFEVVRMPIDMQQELARQGVIFERCFYASNSSQRMPPEELVEQVKAVGVETTVLSSDFGQTFNPPPVEGFRGLLSLMLENGVAARELETMVKTNPRRLLGLP